MTSLKYLEPEVYYELVEKIALRKSEREKFVQSIVKDVREQMDKGDQSGDRFAVAKHFSIYKKMVNQEKTLIRSQTFLRFGIL